MIGKNTSGYVFMLSLGTMSWSSKKQLVVPLSTTETESIVATFMCLSSNMVKKDIGRSQPCST